MPCVCVFNTKIHGCILLCFQQWDWCSLIAPSNAAEGMAPQWVLQAPGARMWFQVSISGRPSVVYVWVLI